MPKKFQDLSKRLLGSSGIILLLGIGFWGYNYLIVQVMTVIFIALMTATAMIEYVNLVQNKGETPSKGFLGALGFFWVILFYLYPSWLWLIFFFLGYFLANFLKVEGAIYRIATGSFAIFYILVPMGMILSILYPTGIGSRGNVMQIVYLLSVTKIADVGGYFVGKMFGKTKLAPIISPSKTVLGAIFGLVCSICVSLLFCQTLQMSLITAAILGLCIGFAAEVGDLAESVLKRDANVKDSNRIPGLGGVLDLIDSLLFTTPILFAYLRF